MQPGWGDNLRSIDVIGDKFDCNEDLTLKDACFVLWAEKGICSSEYHKFKSAMTKHSHRNMPWPAWYGMFEDWSKRRGNGYGSGFGNGNGFGNGYASGGGFRNVNGNGFGDGDRNENGSGIGRGH